VAADRCRSPRVTFAGETARAAAELGVDQIHTAITLTRDMAIAWVVLWRTHGV
jgi:phosphopantetheinyl transferase (holo-ACP synthase)